MNQHATTTTLIAATVVLAAISIASLLTDVYVGVLLLPVAIVLAVIQLSRLARAIRVPDSQLRRRRLRTAAALTAVFVACYLTFLAVIGDTWTGLDTVLAVAGTLSMIGALIYFVAGLLTPRSADAIRQVAG